MRKTVLAVVAASVFSATFAAKKSVTPLTFDPAKGTAESLTMPDGRVVNYTAYTRLFYVTHVEDSTYQYLNVFVPQGATQQTPIFLRTYVGGYMASQASMPQSTDASGRALAEGYVLVIPGTRGRNSTVTVGKKTVYTGRAPKAILDLKAAIRYLRHFDAQMVGNAERIITDGTSAGGAMSALMGGTGNNPAYAKYLAAMGAADERDDVFAAVCFCPITDLQHADMAYEWLYGQTDSRKALGESKQKLIRQLSLQFPDYVNTLGLKKPDGTPLTADNYLDYIRSIIIKSAQEAKDAGATIPDTIGFTFSAMGAFQAPVNGGVRPQRQAMPRMSGSSPKMVGEYITGLDMAKYLNYVVSTQPLKGVPAFDSYQVDGAAASGENEEFGDANGSSVNFTAWSAAQAGTTLTATTEENARLLNPMVMMGEAQTTVAPHWYIRHGARDRDTSFPIPINLATKLENMGKDVNFKLAWNRPHSGDYSLDELFRWIKSVTAQ